MTPSNIKIRNYRIFQRIINKPLSFPLLLLERRCGRWTSRQILHKCVRVQWLRSEITPKYLSPCFFDEKHPYFIVGGKGKEGFIWSWVTRNIIIDNNEVGLSISVKLEDIKSYLNVIEYKDISDFLRIAGVISQSSQNVRIIDLTLLYVIRAEVI